MKVLPIRTLAIFLALTACAPSARSQSKEAAAANEAAYALYSAGNYAEAAAAYEKFLKDYPTDGLVQATGIQLAFTQFFLGSYDKSQATLAKAVSGVPLPPELAEVVDGLLPQILLAKAMALPLADSKRKTTFEEAIKKFSDFITKYPKSADLESIGYRRALANFQIQNYDKVVEELQANVQKFSQSLTISDSRNLLALALATQGSMELAKSSGDKAKGMALLKQGEDILRQIITEKKDIALINDANFQIGEILFTRAALSPEAEREKIYQQALEGYRAILPKEEIEKLQSDEIKDFPSRKAAALRANDIPLKKKLDKENERALRKLQEIKAQPDQIAPAILKMGEIFFNAQKYDESRVLIRHVDPHLSSDDEKMRSLYYSTMGYAFQRAMEKAAEGYRKFLATYKGNPIAESLPFTMGNMYLGLGNPTEAISHFEESLAQYPKGRLVGLSVVSKAQAHAGLRKFDEALKTFQEYLAKNPPPDVGVVAQYGLAGIYKDTARWDDAIAAYTTLKQKFPGTLQAIDSDYWIAISTQQKGDNASAVPLLEAFIKANDKHPNTPLALYALGSAQVALNKKAEGIATFALLAEKFPRSQPAPYTYFMRAQWFASDKKMDESNALMRQFIEKYPQDDRIFFAYDMIAQTSINAAKPDEALTTYMEFVQKYPTSPKAAETLCKISALQRGVAERLAANYSSLNPDEQAKWKEAVKTSISTVEEMVAKYPESPDLALGLQSLMISQRMLLRAELEKSETVEKYFQALAENSANEPAKSKILFTLAAFISEKDKVRSLAKMNEAFKESIVYSPTDLDIYGLALVADGKLDEAAAVFNKLAKDYPNPPGTQAAGAPANIQEAQATSIFGLGRVAQEKKQTPAAGKLFQQLKALYPWSPKVLEADYGIAQSLRVEGKTNPEKQAEAMALLGNVIRATTATAELRANSFLLLGFIMTDKMNSATDAKEKTKSREAAIDSFTKIAQFYAGVPAAAAQGLWEGAQLLEEQSQLSTDPKFKTQQLDRAKGAYKLLVKDYPNSEYAPKAGARLTALGSP